jgi:hypothetical protein
MITSPTPLATPTGTPQVRGTAADAHRNPTDEAAYSGTLVKPVKVRKTVVSSVDACELGCWSLFQEVLYE